MQGENASSTQLMSIRLISSTPTILNEPNIEPGVPISIQLTLNAPLERTQMSIRDIWISLKRTTKIHTIKAKLASIVSNGTKVNPISNDAYKMVERSGGMVEDDVLRLNASALIFTGPDGLCSYTKTPAAFHIVLRIPGNLAGTVESPIGSISYTLFVNAVTVSGINHVVSIPLYIRRLMMASSSDGPLVYIRRWPNTTMSIKTTIPRVVSAHGVFQVQAVLSRTPSSNGRTSTRLKVLEVKWAVDEIVRVMSIMTPNIDSLPSQSRETKRHTRRLSNGKIGSNCFKEHSSNNNVEIDFHVILTKRLQALCDVQKTYPDGPCNETAEGILPGDVHASRRLDILVSHVLAIEFVVDEAVFDNKTGQRLNLPALLKHVHGSNHVLRVGEVSRESDSNSEIEYLPQYSEWPNETLLFSNGQ